MATIPKKLPPGVAPIKAEFLKPVAPRPARPPKPYSAAQRLGGASGYGPVSLSEAAADGGKRVSVMREMGPRNLTRSLCLCDIVCSQSRSLVRTRSTITLRRTQRAAHAAVARSGIRLSYHLLHIEHLVLFQHVCHFPPPHMHHTHTSSNSFLITAANRPPFFIATLFAIARTVCSN